MKNGFNFLILLLLIHLLASNSSAIPLMNFPEMDQSLDKASVKTDGTDLIVSTGKITRRWKLLPRGMKTVSLLQEKTDKEWTDRMPSNQPDWDIPGLEDTCRLMDLTVKESEDQGFTSKHLETTVTLEYPRDAMILKYVIWAYPDAPGLRTQLFLKRTGKPKTDKETMSNQPIIELKLGNQFFQRNGLKVADPWYCSMDLNDKTISYMISNLKENSYVLGFSWWDYGGGGRVQKVRITSLDLEARITLLEPTTLPGWKGKKQKPAEHILPVPSEVIVGDSFRLFVDKIEGFNANISEIWLYEKTRTGSGPIVAGPPQRIAELTAKAPDGFRLAAYYNAGEKTSADEKIQYSGRVDFLPIDCSKYNRRYIGYYNDTQNRNKPDTPILKEQVKTELLQDVETIDWASIACLEDNTGGLMMLKESHKCPNQSGVFTGKFIGSAKGLQNTGTSLKPSEIKTDKFRWCWASWTLLYDGSDLDRQLVLKQFDRIRYPVMPERDMWTLVCTWGHSKNPRDGRNYAIEKEILRSMDLTAKMGADLLLVDDGWQISLEAKNPTPDGGIGWKPHPSTYPEGWKNVIAKKKELGLLIGLWGIAQKMPVEDMKWNWDQIQMRQLKLDFARLGNHNALAGMMDRAREFILYANHGCIMSWDTTERAPRYGYWWAREYGNVHFMNRKPDTPPSVVYRPALALRDFWLLSKYQNLNKWQLTVHNPGVVNPKHSDAYKHSPTYCVAASLMGIPQFFALPRYYSEQALKDIRSLLDIHKKHRLEIFTSYVLPIGNQPNNKSWAGFQTIHPDRDSGHLLIFRELNNKNSTQKIKLHAMGGKTMILMDVQTRKSRTVTVEKDGSVEFQILTPADFRLLKYKIKD